LCRELHGHAAVRRGFRTGPGRRDYAVVVTAGQVHPGTDLVSPAHDVAVVRLDAEPQCRLPGGLRGLAVAGVVLDAAHQQRDPPGLDQDFPVLLERHPLALHLGHPAEPGPAFGQQLVGRHERVLRAQPVGHDPQGVERSRVHVRPLQPAHQLQRVHPRHRQDIGLIAPRCGREHRMRDRAERRGDDRLIELIRLHLACFPPLVLPQQAGSAG
jgi:hypothetical protein